MPENFGWPSVDQVREWWPDAPDDDQLLLTLLNAAISQCDEYAPQLSGQPAYEAQDRFRLAALMQTRALWQASRTDPSGMLGDDGFQVRVYPMDWTVKNLLRPKRGIPVVG